MRAFGACPSGRSADGASGAVAPARQRLGRDHGVVVGRVGCRSRDRAGHSVGDGIVAGDPDGRHRRPGHAAVGSPDPGGWPSSSPPRSSRWRWGQARGRFGFQAAGGGDGVSRAPVWDVVDPFVVTRFDRPRRGHDAAPGRRRDRRVGDSHAGAEAHPAAADRRARRTRCRRRRQQP